MEKEYKKAREFLEKITPKNKVAIITHDDLDGICSGIILHDFVEFKTKSLEIFFFSYNKGKDDFDLSKFDTVIISDLAPNLLQELFRKIEDKKVLYIDHHPKNEKVPENFLEIRSPSWSSCSRITFEICGSQKNKWVSLCGVIGDAGDKFAENKEFLDSFLKKEDVSLDDFRYKYAYRFGNMLVYLDENPRKSFDLLRSLESYKEISKVEKYILPVDKEIEKTLEEYKKKMEKLGDITFFVFEPKYGIKSVIINIISFSASKEDIFAFLTQFEDEYRISFRAQSRKTNGPKLLKDCGVENAGGHNAACGGSIKKGFLKQFKENLKNYDIKKARVLD